MSNLMINDLAFDSALDSEAMDQLAGGWGIPGISRIGRYAKRKIAGGIRGINYLHRGIRGTASKIFRNRSRNNGARFVFGALWASSPAGMMNVYLAS